MSGNARFAAFVVVSLVVFVGVLRIAIGARAETHRILSNSSPSGSQGSRTGTRTPTLDQLGIDLTVAARSQDGSAEETLTCAYEGEEELLGFNPEFLLDALNVLDTETIAFEWNGRAAPGKIIDGDYTYVVMPVNLE